MGTSDDVADSGTRDASAGDAEPEGEASSDGGNDAIDVRAADVRADVPAIDAHCSTAHLDADPLNCGRCGHDCQGGACQAGRCQPVLLAAAQPIPMAARHTLATNGTTVFWTTGEVQHPAMMIDSGGGTPVPMVSLDSPHPSVDIGLNATGVYWEVFWTGVWKADFQGGAPFIVAPSFRLQVMVVGPTAVCGRSTPVPLESSSWCHSFGSGDQTTFAKGHYVEQIAIDATSVYWSSGGSVWKTDLGGGVDVLLAPAEDVEAVEALATDSRFLYWTTRNLRVMKVNVGGGAPVQLASTSNRVTNLTVDETGLYWVDGGEIVTVGLDGGTPVPLTSGQSAWHLALSSSSIFWLTRGTEPVGDVMKLAK